MFLCYSKSIAIRLFVRRCLALLFLCYSKSIALRLFVPRGVALDTLEEFHDSRESVRVPFRAPGINTTTQNSSAMWAIAIAVLLFASSSLAQVDEEALGIAGREVRPCRWQSNFFFFVSLFSAERRGGWARASATHPHARVCRAFSRVSMCAR